MTGPGVIVTPEVSGRLRELWVRSMTIVAPVESGVVLSVSLRLTTTPSWWPAPRVTSWARSGIVISLHFPGTSGVGVMLERACAASTQPRLSTEALLAAKRWSTSR